MDDFVILYRKQDEPQFIRFETALLQTYEMRSLGNLSWFLGVRITRNLANQKLYLCQDSYIEKTIEKYHISINPHIYTPLGSNDLTPHTGTASPQEIYAY